MALVMLTVVWWKYVVAIKRYAVHGVANMDTLVWLGTTTAFVYSLIASTLAPIYPEIFWWMVFYEAVVVVIGFIEIGKYMEHKVMSKTWKAIKALVWLQAKAARIKKDGEFIEVPIESVEKWAIMLVKPGEKIPLDWVIVEWSWNIDESMITGEPVPVKKHKGDEVIWSTFVTNSTLQVEATAVWEDTYLHQIITIVQEAQNSKPPIQKLADSIMKYFIPTVLVIALLAWLFWLLFGNSFYPDINALQFAIISFVWVLVIACPCWLGLATPMAIITWLWHGAKNGILAKNAEWLLKLRKSKCIVFDKTWTITQWKPKLVEMSRDDIDTLSILASLESLSSHPIASAIVEYAKNKDIALQEVENFENLEWVGLSWDINGTTYYITKPSYLEELWLEGDMTHIDTWTSQWKTPLILSTKKEVVWYFAVADPLKESSKWAIDRLKKMGITPVLLTWDHIKTAQYIASQVWIQQIHAGVKPEEKASIITDLKWDWLITMVWDGINDAPALATADIWIAMSTWTDVAIESADLTLLHGDIAKLEKAIKISKLTQTAVIQNLVWAFGFNLIGIPLAAWVFYPLMGVLLSPAFEWAAMSMSSLMVVANSLRLQKKKI